MKKKNHQQCIRSIYSRRPGEGSIKQPTAEFGRSMTRILAQIVRARWALPDGRFLLLLFINKNRFYIIKDNERSETRVQREKCVMCILDHAGRQWKNENEKDSAKPQDRRRTSQFDQQQQQQRPNRETNNHKIKERERGKESEKETLHVQERLACGEQDKVLEPPVHHIGRPLAYLFILIILFRF